MKPDELIDAMIQGIERAAPEAVFGRLSAYEHGFSVRTGDTTYAVKITVAFNWDAPVIDNEAGAGMFDDYGPCTPSREDLEEEAGDDRS